MAASIPAQSVITIGFSNPQFSCPSSEVTFDLVLVNESEYVQTISSIELSFITPDTELYDIDMKYLDGSAVDITLDVLLNNTSNAALGFSGPLRLVSAIWDQIPAIEVGAFQSLTLATMTAKSRTHLSNDFLGHIRVLGPANNGLVIQGDLGSGTVLAPINYNWIAPENPTNIIATTNCPCIDYKNINGHPSSDLVNQVSTQIMSIDTLGFNEYGHYRAGDNIMLNAGFEVNSQGEFDADIETCPDDCLSDPVCEGPPCDFPEFEVDADGNKYVPNQILFSAPSGLVLPLDFENAVKDDLDAFLGVPTEKSTIKKCLCNQNIAIYEVTDPDIHINEECCRGSSTGQVYEDGGAVYSVNHYVEADVVHADAFAMPSNLPRLLETLSNVNPSATKVAYLDSGVNTAMIPDGSIVYSETPSGQICGNNGNTLTDTIGWNFIANTADVTDDRGHGTAVFFSHLSGLYQQGLTETDQATLVVKVLDECGVGTAFSTSCGLYYAAASGVDLINASWGLYANNPTIQLAVEEIKNDVVLVTSAGNQSKDLSSLEHFPSGYGYDYVDAVDPGMTKTGLPKVFEVANICRPVEEDSCDPDALEELWIGSNFRTNDVFFAEPGVKIEAAILKYSKEKNLEITCSIVGTSYAAPQFTSGLTYRLQNNLSVSKTAIVEDGQKYQPVPSLSYYSLILNNLNCN